MENNDVGKRIAKLRKENGWSQVELAGLLNVSDKAVSKWENGGMPGVDLFPKLSKVFNVSIDYLMLGEESELDEENKFENDEAIIVSGDPFADDLSVEDIELILADQQDLYTEEELQILQKRYQEVLEKESAVNFEREEARRLKEEEERKLAISRLPKNLVCPKCDGVNTEPNQFCEYCGCDFLDYWNFYEEDEEDEDVEDKDVVEKVGCLGYGIAVLFPIIGLIWAGVKGAKGAILFSIIMLVINIISAILSYNMLISLFTLF